MFERKGPIFRKEALERLSSPERLDELIEVVDPHSWIALVTLASLIAVALLWSIVGRLPTTVTGRGVLVRPRNVVELQAPASGRLISLNVRVGSSVKKGAVLGNIEQAGLRTGSRIISEHPGRVLELAANVGQSLSHGQRLLSLEVEDAGAPAAGVIYFQTKDGPKLEPGMQVQITPDSVQRERFGSIVGKVRTVSSFPVTKVGATSLIANSELAESFLSEGPRIEVVVDLERDPSTFSGYRWSSSTGPPMRISSGLTAIARVTVEDRAPITYILPHLRSTVGAY